MANAGVTADVFGTLGAVCWSVQLIPQIYQNYRSKDTLGLQPTMMLLWASAGIPLGIYNITRSFPIALQIQPQILTFLSLVTWAQTQYYPPARLRKPRSVMWCVSVLSLMCIIAGAVEVGIIFGLKAATRHKTEDEVEFYWPAMLMGVLSAVLLCAGVGRHYIDIYKERTVRGISFLFVGIDALGDLTSLISVIFWWKAGKTLDVLGVVIYASELMLWCGVFACAACLNLPVWVREKIAARKEVIQERQSDLGQMDGGRDNSGQVERAPSETSTRGSTTSRRSDLSGTCFRTASGRILNMPGDEAGIDETRHDALRLRNVIQLGA